MKLLFRQKIKKVLPLITILIISLMLSGCKLQDPAESSSQSWQTIFEDTFTRANSNDLSIGSDWAAQKSVIKIVSNEVYCSKPTSGNTMGAALYNKDIGDSKIRITTKFRTGDYSPNQSYIFARASINYSSGYAAFVDNNSECALYKISGGNGTRLISAPYTLEKNKTYIFEFTLEITRLLFIIKDSSGATLKTIETTDTDFSTGYAGFMGGEQNGTEQPVYFSYFKIEVYK